MNASLPTSASWEQPLDGATPPEVFSRWMKVVCDSVSSPLGPSWAPTTVSRSQATAPCWTKSGSVEEVAVWAGSAAAQTVLVSEVCHAARIAPLATTLALVLGSPGLGADPASVGRQRQREHHRHGESRGVREGQDTTRGPILRCITFLHTILL